MGTTTTRYGLYKIDSTVDLVNVVTDFNNNWDAIDLKLGTQVCTSSTRPASPVQGMTIYETDTFFTRVYSGSAWRTVGNATSTTSALPASPIQGDIDYMTDIGALAYYSGSAWHMATIPLVTTSTIPTGSSIQTGAVIFASDTASFLVDVGSSTWRHKTVIVCTSSTRPTSNLGTGTHIFETDTGRSLIYTGSNWVPYGQMLMATPTSTSSNGTTGSTTTGTEVFDAVLGYHSVALVSGRRYQATLNGLIGNAGAASDAYTLQIRDSQSASNPTGSSTLIAQSEWTAVAAGSSGRTSIQLSQSFLSTVTGTHTFGVSYTKIIGTGPFTPVGTRELFIEDMGAAY